MVSLRFKDEDSHFCGGTLIAPNIILSAAHCFKYSTSGDVRAILGEHDRADFDSPGEEFLVEEIVVHPAFDDENLMNDIALLKLSEESYDYELIKLNNVSIESDEIVALNAGWGATSFDGSTSEVLLEVNVNILEQYKCDFFLTMLSLDPVGRMCSMTEGSGFCFGDSGGPLFFSDDNGQYIQLGIISFFFGDCGSATSPTYYIDVSLFNDWIVGTICDGETPLSLDSIMCKTTDHPSLNPSISYVPSKQCEDLPGWTWIAGAEIYTCEDFENNGWCCDYGDVATNEYGFTANDACCICKEGKKEGKYSLVPTTTPSCQPFSGSSIPSMTDTMVNPVEDKTSSSPYDDTIPSTNAPVTYPSSNTPFYGSPSIVLTPSSGKISLEPYQTMAPIESSQPAVIRSEASPSTSPSKNQESTTSPRNSSSPTVNSQQNQQLLSSYDPVASPADTYIIPSQPIATDFTAPHRENLTSSPSAKIISKGSVKSSMNFSWKVFSFIISLQHIIMGLK